MQKSESIFNKLSIFIKKLIGLQPASPKKAFRKIMPQLNLEDRFTQIYKINYWGSHESASGVGSTLQVTENLRNELPILFNQFGIKRIFDGPCGDFHWMQHIVNIAQLQYIGGDIVAPLIESNQSKYASESVEFIRIDLTKDAIPSTDLMICRDCLFHLSFADIKLVLVNFVQSQTPFLLTTSYKNNGDWENKDIITGHFRLIDLFSAPYQFSTSTLYQIEDWLPPDNQRSLYLWSREQVIQALNNMQ